jgi:hypothetical protein
MTEDKSNITFTHKINKTEEHTDYQKRVTKTGEEVEIIGYYKTDPIMISVQPDHTQTINKLLEVLRGTGISKITITLLDKNLPEKGNE